MAMLLLQSCGGSSSSSDASDEFDTLGLIANEVDSAVIPSYENFSEVIDQLSSESGSLNAYCDALGTDQESVTLETAQTHWSQAMAIWQNAEMWLLGPITDNSLSIRNRIYSYGEENFISCFADQGVVSLNANPNISIAGRAANHVGLSALEYLLFNQELNHSCTDDLSALSQWNDLPELDRKQQRCAFASAVAEDIKANIDGLENTWDASGENYRLDFVNPANTGESLQALSDSLFYLDTVVKDLKVARPIGLVNGVCEGESDSSAVDFNAVESPYSETSYENIESNLIAFRTLYTGGDGLGFDDIVISSGQPDFHQQFMAKIQAALDLLATFEQSFAADVEAINPEDGHCTQSLNADSPIDGLANPYNLHIALRAITDDLKTSFLVITALDIPDRAQSDND